MKRIVKRWFAETKGATAVEYGLMAAGISIAILLAVFTFGGNMAGMFDEFSNWLGG
jgi:pilus assembly protein Flp/PilA